MYPDKEYQKGVEEEYDNTYKFVKCDCKSEVNGYTVIKMDCSKCKGRGSIRVER